MTWMGELVTQLRRLMLRHGLGRVSDDGSNGDVQPAHLVSYIEIRIKVMKAELSKFVPGTKD